MTKIIGLTGGIGSGKTTISKFFSEFGIPVYIADDEAKKISALPETVHSIRTTFGESIFDNGQLNREKLAKIVFNNPEKLKVLNAIIHPAVRAHFESWLKKHTNAALVVKEAAILFESGSYKDCDFVITVTAPLETRISRVLERDATTRENVINRIDSQWTDEQRISKSDYVIKNVNLNASKMQVEEILKKLTIQ